MVGNCAFLKQYFVGISLFLWVFVCQAQQISTHQTSTTKKVTPVKTADPKENMGWHYYWDDEKKKEKEKKTKKELPSIKAAPSSSKKISPFSTQWFKQNFQIIEQRAIDSPNKKNMRALLYAERVMADKSEVFARRKRFIQSVDPLLQEGTRIPMNGAAKNAFLIYKDDQREAAFKELATKVGLVFFYDGMCGFCQKMIPVINLIKIKTGMDIRVFVKNSPKNYVPKLNKGISVYPDNGYSKRFHLSFWPAVVMLNPPLDVYVVGQGSVGYRELTQRMLNVAFDRNVLNEEWYYRVYPEEKGLIAPEQLRAFSGDVVEDPVELINSVVDMLEKAPHIDDQVSKESKE